MLRVAVFATTAKGVFSGGRYHAMMIAQVLARLGHEAYFVTTNVPIFAEDIAPISPDNPVRIIQTKDFDVSPAVPFDAVFVAPQMSIFPRLYKNAVRFARESGAALILINFESPNWFNSLSPTPRPAEKWREWLHLAKEGALVLSSAAESEKFAREYYTDLPPEASFDIWQPAINSVACVETPEQERQKLIILFARPSDAHKGGGDIAELIGPELSGYTIGLIIGNPHQSEQFITELSIKGEPHGVRIEPYFALSDRQKFMLLKRASAVVFSSYFEGYGYPPLEALASDTPCVAYDLPVVRENCGDLIRYAPVGDIDALRRELVAALEAGAVSTSNDPHVIELTDVDARARALEAVIETQREHLRTLRFATPDATALRLQLAPATVAHMRRKPHVLFTLSAAKVIEGVTTSAEGVEAQIVRGTWDGNAWRHDVLLTLADKKYLGRLSKVVLQLQFGGGRISLPLDRLSVRRRMIHELPKTSAGFSKAFRRDDRLILLGWVYPERSYDDLILIDEKGLAIGATTAIKNLNYKKTNPIDPAEFCGFITGTLDLKRFTPGALRLLLIDKGTIVAIGHLNTRDVMEKADTLPLIGVGEAAPEPEPMSSEIVARAMASSAPLKTDTYAAPLIRRPMPMTGFLARANEFFTKTFGPKASTAPVKRVVEEAPALVSETIPARKFELEPLPEVEWAVSECTYLEDSGELRVRGWTSLPDRVHVEIWDNDLRPVGTAVNGELRPDVATKLKAKGRADFGFVYQQPFDGDLDQAMNIRLMDGPRLVAQKLIDAIKPKKATQPKVDDYLYDAQWKTMWMRGTYDMPNVELVGLELARGKDVIASAAIDEKFHADGRRYYKWRMESVVDEPPQVGEKLKFRATSRDGVTRRISYSLPDPSKWSEGVAKANEELLYAEGGDPTTTLVKFAGALPHTHAVKRILVVVHNLNAIERGEKREALLALRNALRWERIELIFLHHSKLPSGCALPEINFYSKDVEKLLKDPKVLEKKLAQFAEFQATYVKKAAEALPEPESVGPDDIVDFDAEAIDLAPAEPPAAMAPPLVGKTVKDGPIVEPAMMNYAQRMLYGFGYALNRRPRPWADIEKQTAEELARVDIVMRLVRPSLVLVWHQWNSLMLIARAVADHYEVPSAIIHEGMLPGTMTIDALGMMAESDATGVTIAENAETAPFFERARKVIEEIRTKELDRKPQAGTPAASELLRRLKSRGQKIVFYAGVNDWQSGNLPSDHPRAKIHSPFYKDTMDGLEALLQAAERLDFLVLFKPHPNLFPRSLDLQHERLIYVREANATDCIVGSDVTVTLLSSLAYISLAHRKPTVLLGRNTLSDSHAAYEFSDYDSLDACLTAALAERDLDRRLKTYEAHVAALLQKYLFPYGDITNFSMLTLEDTVEKLKRIMDQPSFEHL